MPAPLAERLRPHTFDEYLGQQHLIGPNAALRRMIEAGQCPSIILWGPPGVGKTTLAYIIAKTLNKPYFQLSAINSGVKDIREVIEKAGAEEGAILFIDEIHRFSKSQQDSLLGAVEKGTITLIGATTENPSFEVISALLSRCTVYTLKPLSEEELVGLINTAVTEDELLKQRNVEVKETEALLRISGGDARKLLNAVDLVINSVTTGPVVITNDLVLEAIQQNMAMYDKSGEQHYDIISAFIKSMRGSDPNGAVYWLARMIEGGEDPLFIARRMVILASEDIGNANPTALVMATTCFDAVNKIGFPEGRIILSQCATYLASSPKSNASYEAIGNAMDLVRRTGDLPVPLHLRNAPTKLMKNMGYGDNYKYAHTYENNFVEQEFLPDKVSGTVLYNPGPNARENELREFLRRRWNKKYGY
jgi:putative ATPase